MALDLDLSPFDLRSLDAEDATVYALDDAQRICFVNRGWSKFALENGADWAMDPRLVLGMHVMQPIPTVLRPFYARMFDAVLVRGEVAEHDYECSSPSRLRQFRMRMLPRRAGGAVIVHSLLVEVASDRAARSPSDALFRKESGLIVQCSHCRRVQRAGEPQLWDWVPAYVQSPPARLSHGLCRVCTLYHYPDAQEPP